MVKIRRGDLFETWAEYIAQQVICQSREGRMGSGVGKQIRLRYPEAYRMYIYGDRARLGDIQVVLCHDEWIRPGNDLSENDPDRSVINMFAQERYGNDGGLYTDYRAFRSCLKQIEEKIPYGETIAMPYGIGCGDDGGGDWGIIESMIVDELGDNYEVELWKGDPI